MKISIIIPAYNEEKRIATPLESYASFFRSKKQNKNIEDFRIIVVINNTTDKTEEVVKKLKKKYKEIEYLNFKQGGKGFAVKEGFKYALEKKDDIVGFTDADVSTPPASFYKLIQNIKENDGAIASRYLPDSVIKPELPFIRIFVSRVFNFLVRSLFFLNYKDTQCGAKIFKREALKKLIGSFEMTQWAFDVDMLYNARKLGLKIKEVPIFWSSAEEGKLKVKKASAQMFFAIIQLRILRSPIKKAWWFFKPLVGLLYSLFK